MTDLHDDFKKDLLSIAAHDLKTPIVAVRGFLELVENVGPLTDQQQTFLTRAFESLDRMDHLIANVLELARLESDTPIQIELCDLQQLIDACYEYVEKEASAREITLSFNVPEDISTVVGDPHLLTQVFNHLLSNAVKFNRDKGQINVTVQKQSKWLRVDIQDTGNGIQEKDLQHIFEKFYRASSIKRIEGTGLGLAIVEMVIIKHGGRIWVKSAVGEGSTFTFLLPYQQDSTNRRSSNVHVGAYSSEESDGIDDRMQDSRESLEKDSSDDNF